MRATTGGHARPDVQRARARHLIAMYEADRNRGTGKRPGLRSVVEAVQGGLSGMGLSGAAHPVRRLHHPGGLMMLPTFGGRGGMLNAGERAATRAAPGAFEPPVRSMAERLAMHKAKEKEISASYPAWRVARDLGIAAPATLGGIVGLMYGASKLPDYKMKHGIGWYLHHHESPPKHHDPRKAPGWGKAHSEYQRVLDNLVRTDQITLAQSVRADAWAGWQSAPTLRVRSNELRHKYRLSNP